MTPILQFLAAAVGVGVVAIVVAGTRSVGVHFLEGCTKIVITDSAEVKKAFSDIAKDPEFTNAIEATNHWLNTVSGGGADDCFNIKAPGAIPDLPSREVAAVYLLYYWAMIELFVTHRQIDPQPWLTFWYDLAQYWSLSDAEINDMISVVVEE